MFFTASGSTFEIGTARADWIARRALASDFDGEVWVPVAGVSNLGRIAGEWQTDENYVLSSDDPDDPQILTISKIGRPARSMQVIAAVVVGDAGQEAMLLAESSVHPFGFRIVTPDGSMRRFVAFVLEADHVFDEANSVMCWSFYLKLQSDIQRNIP